MGGVSSSEAVPKPYKGSSAKQLRSNTPKTEAAAKLEDAMTRCNSALQYLTMSASVLTSKRNSAKTEAVKAFTSGNKDEAVALMRKANLAENDLQTIRTRQLAIERQRGLIEKQQLNTMLTSVLVETSAALHSANSVEAVNGEHPADAIHIACEQLEEVADIQAEIQNSHSDFDGIAAASSFAATQLITEEMKHGYADDDFELQQLKALAIAAAEKKGTPETNSPKPKPPSKPDLEVCTDLPTPPPFPILPGPGNRTLKRAEKGKSSSQATPIII